MLDPNLFQLMTEQVKDYAVFLLDPAGCILSWNLGAQKIKGYAPEEIIGQHFSVFYPSEEIKREWPAYELDRAMADGRFEDEGFRVRKDGSRFWANVVITALRSPAGELLGYSKITRDLTDRRQHEESLRQSEERFRLLVEGVLDYAIYMLDPEGHVSSWNSGAERITGYPRTEILGRHFSTFYPPEDLVAGNPDKELLMARHHGRAEDEGWRVRKDGQRFWARVVVTPLHDASGRLRGYAKVTQDLSQQRQLEELAVTTKNLNNFIALLSHEIRNPIAPIRTAVTVMENFTPDDPAQIKMRQIIDRQSARLARMADDLLDINRITRGKLAIQQSLVDIGQLIEQSVETSTSWIESKQHRLRVELPKEALTVRGDMQRLIQVVTNLLNNAARYTAPGGDISVGAWREGEFVILSVRDTGRGIRLEHLESIFKMFVQGRAPLLERADEGLGIGLALSRSIVALHGGTIVAFSEGEGKGSEFIVQIPVAAQLADGAAAARAKHAPGATAQPRKVLIVDDYVDTTATLEMLVQVMGHTTRISHNGTEAVKIFDEFEPDIVLLDIGLPGMNGYDVARCLRERRPTGFRLVAISGWGHPEDRQRSADAGFERHLVKPVNVAELRTLLEAETLG